MLNLLPLSPGGCLYKYWGPPKDLAFLAERTRLPLHSGELTQAAAVMPLGATKVGSKQWQLVALCGVLKHQNLWVEKGRWVGNYRPQCLDTLPFEYVSVDGRGIIAFDRASGLEVADTDQGVPFFTPQGEVHPAVKPYFTMLKRRYTAYKEVENILGLMEKLHLLVPWTRTGLDELGIEADIEGLYQLDEHVLASLSDIDFLALRTANALPLVFALKNSAHHLNALGRWSMLSGGRYRQDSTVFKFPVGK